MIHKSTLIRHLLVASCFSVTVMFTSCGSSDKPETPPAEPAAPAEPSAPAPSSDASYPETIDETLASKGKELFTTKCTACHQLEAKQIGPALKGVTSRRSYAWINSMLENPQEWVKTDKDAEALLKEYNNVPMVIPGGTTEEERKALIEYLRSASK